MSDEIIIRHTFKSGDIGTIISLHGNLYAKEYDYDYTFEAYVGEALSQFAIRNDPKEKIWIVEQSEEIVGSIAICKASDSEAQLRWFLISPKLRGQGIGKKLIAEALGFAQKKSYKSIMLWTVDGLLASKNIYLKNDFILSESITHDIWGAKRIEQKYSRLL